HLRCQSHRARPGHAQRCRTAAVHGELTAMHLDWRWCVSVPLVLVCFGLSGCGSRRTDVSGQVTYNGKPLDKPGATISFYPEKGDMVATTIGTDGSYRAVGVSMGQNKVAVAYQRTSAASKPGSRAPKNPAAVAPKEQAESPFLTPETYAFPE